MLFWIVYIFHRFVYDPDPPASKRPRPQRFPKIQIGSVSLVPRWPPESHPEVLPQADFSLHNRPLQR